MCKVSILFIGFFQGEFPDTDPTKFTDEELGIPPGTNILRLFLLSSTLRHNKLECLLLSSIFCSDPSDVKSYHCLQILDEANLTARS